MELERPISREKNHNKFFRTKSMHNYFFFYIRSLHKYRGCEICLFFSAGFRPQMDFYLEVVK